MTAVLGAGEAQEAQPGPGVVEVTLAPVGGTAEQERAAPRAAELNLEFTRVTAPITGRVGRAILTGGNLVSTGPGEATLLTAIVSLDPMYAYFEADERLFLRYMEAASTRNGGGVHVADMPVRMALTNDEGFPREGRLDFLDSRVNAATGTIRGRAVFPTSDGELTPELFVRLQLAGNRRVPGLLIQDRAVGTDLDR